MVFQLDTICDQDTDAAILKALEDLPRDLSETFDRVLRKSCAQEKDRNGIRAKIFEIVTAAQRPLSMDELREALNVKIGEIAWDETELINDMSKTIAAFGSLLIIDEEYLTVHFAHHSVKQHIYSKNTDSGANSYYINLREAESRWGEICVTYLNLGIFETRVARVAQTPQKLNYSANVIRSSLSQNSVAGRLTLKLLKTRREHNYDITSFLEQMRPTAQDETRKDHAFLSYSQEFWLLHTKSIASSRGDVDRLWYRLLDGEVTVVTLPWAPEKWDQLGDYFINWMVKMEHEAVLNLVDDLVKISPERKRIFTKISSAMEQRLQERQQKLNFESEYVSLMMYMALENDAMPLAVLLQKNLNGADISAAMDKHRNAFIAASYSGFTALVKIFLRKGVDINHVGPEGTALYVASERGHVTVVRLLLENGADVNARYESKGTALTVASYRGYETIVRLLLENGAEVNALDGAALINASLSGHKDTVQLLLENGADINARSWLGTALEVTHSAGVTKLLEEAQARANFIETPHATDSPPPQGATERG